MTFTIPTLLWVLPLALVVTVAWLALCRWLWERAVTEPFDKYVTRRTTTEQAKEGAGE